MICFEIATDVPAGDNAGREGKEGGHTPIRVRTCLCVDNEMHHEGPQTCPLNGSVDDSHSRCAIATYRLLSKWP
jgi:hypothetical protein